MSDDELQLNAKSSLIYLIYKKGNATCKIGYVNSSLTSLVRSYRRAYGSFQGLIAKFEDETDLRPIEKLIHDTLKLEKQWEGYELFYVNDHTIDCFVNLITAQHGELFLFFADTPSILIHPAKNADISDFKKDVNNSKEAKLHQEHDREFCFFGDETVSEKVKQCCAECNINMEISSPDMIDCNCGYTICIKCLEVKVRNGTGFMCSICHTKKDIPKVYYTSSEGPLVRHQSIFTNGYGKSFSKLKAPLYLEDGPGAQNEYRTFSVARCLKLIDSCDYVVFSQSNKAYVPIVELNYAYNKKKLILITSITKNPSPDHLYVYYLAKTSQYECFQIANNKLRFQKHIKMLKEDDLHLFRISQTLKRIVGSEKTKICDLWSNVGNSIDSDDEIWSSDSEYEFNPAESSYAKIK